MTKFIEIVDGCNDRRLVNIDHISDIFENYIYLDSASDGKQIKINCKHSYSEIKEKLLAAGAEIY